MNETRPKIHFTPRQSLISVLVPAYNHYEYIEACLDSILLSTNLMIELIIIDDGSTDNTFDKAQEWILKNKTSFVNIILKKQRNKGVAETLNTLFKLSSGNYIVVIASDDILTLGSINVRLKEFEKNEKIIAVFGDCYSIDQTGMITAVSVLRDMYFANISALSSPRRIRRELIMRWSIPGPVGMFRRIAYDSVLGDEKYDQSMILEDRNWYLKVMSNGSIKYIDCPVAYYRIHGYNAISNRDRRLQMMQDMIKSEENNLVYFSGLDYLALKITTYRNRCVLYNQIHDSLISRIELLIIKIAYRLFYVIDQSILSIYESCERFIQKKLQNG